MISEPELEGEDGPQRGTGRPGPAGTAVPSLPGQRGGPGSPQGSGAEAVVVGDGIPQPVPRRAALTWGLWGALAASLLWGAGLTLHHARGPDLGGYGPERELCLDAPLFALTEVLGPSDEPEAVSDETAAVDRAVCRTDLGPAPGGSPLHRLPTTSEEHSGIRTLVDLTYVLHRTTDPAPEFDALPAPKTPGSALRALRVPDLGDRAYLITDSAGGGSPTLRVLDGRAEFTLSVRVYSSYDGSRVAASDVRPEYVASRLVTDVLAPAMTDDLRSVMKTVRAGGSTG